MNADHTPARRAAPIHRSARTQISENVDGVTGQRTQLLSTSELTLAWVGDDLQVKYRASRMAIDPDKARRGPRGIS